MRHAVRPAGNPSLPLAYAGPSMPIPSRIVTTPLRVLLIEASETDAAVVVRLLTRGGYTVVFERVESPEALTAALDGGSWDLAIADYTMPRFSGTAALELLRERDPDMPFIFVSGTIGEDAVVAAIKTGAHDYITKGQMKRLVPAIDRELRDARCGASGSARNSASRIWPITTPSPICRTARCCTIVSSRPCSARIAPASRSRCS